MPESDPHIGPEKINRRKFIKHATLAGTALSLGHSCLLEKKKNKKIIIVGAGLAGLTAGYELMQLGHEVTILEARDRVGGKVLTIREPFSEGLHAQAGGTAFWSFRNDIAKDYIDKFQLPVVKNPDKGERQVIDYYKGQIIENINDSPLNWHRDLSNEEQSLTLSELQGKYINPVVDEFIDAGYPDNTSSLIEKYDQVSAHDVLSGLGASDPAIRLLINRNFDFLGKDPKSVSAFYLFSVYANSRLVTGPPYQIEGGNDRLPLAFAEQLKDHIRFESVVQEIEQTSSKTIVTYLNGAQSNTIESDYLVITVPFSVLRTIQGISGFSEEKQKAIHIQDELATCPVFLQTREAFWEKNGYSGRIQSDLPISYVWPGTVPMDQGYGLLEVFITSETGAALAKLSPDERISFVLNEMEKVLPGIQEQFVAGYSKPWINDPFARGCFAYFRVGEITRYYPYFAKPEGRIHFAGSHTASLELWSFMQGAIQSGKRVANEINKV